MVGDGDAAACDKGARIVSGLSLLPATSSTKKEISAGETSANLIAQHESTFKPTSPFFSLSLFSSFLGVEGRAFTPPPERAEDAMLDPWSRARDDPTERELSTKRKMIGLYDRGLSSIRLTTQQSIKGRVSTLGRCWKTPSAYDYLFFFFHSIFL